MEEWADIAGYERYQVSTLGRVRNSSTGKILKPFVDEAVTNRLAVSLYSNRQKKNIRVHILVAKAFLGDRPDGMHICHNNGNNQDNSLRNLRYDTPSANMIDSVIHGTHALARKTHCINGHEFTESNTKRDSRGHRHCRECSRIRRRVRG